MRLKFSISILTLSFILKGNAQQSFVILDSLDKPIIGATIGVEGKNYIQYSDFSGKVELGADIPENEVVVISHLGYERQKLKKTELSHTIILKAKVFRLRESIVKPVSPKSYIEMAADSFQKNHVPFVFDQKMFFREEFVVNNSYLRFQELDILLHQFPKNNDKREYYRANSYPEIKRMYRMDDYKEMGTLKNSLGKIISKNINFNQLSLYSYSKGSNILNLIFTELLTQENVEFTMGSSEDIKGIEAIHIIGKHYANKTLLYTTELYLDPETMAVLHFSLLATGENVTKHWIDFKTRTLLWLLGVKVQIKQFYCKVQFEKNEKNFWTVSDFMAMIPIEVTKKTKLNGYYAMSYRVDSKIEKSKIPSGSKIYGQNQVLFNAYQSGIRFGDNLNYSIPLVPYQKARLAKMISGK